MAFSGVWMVDGFRVSGTLGRLQLQSATRKGNGIVEAGDLRLKAGDSVSGGAASPVVNIGDGACVARGRERLWQGSYYGYNIGDIPITVSPTAGTGRSDLVYARVEDPTISSSPWDHTGPDDNVWYPVYKTGVANTTKTVPAGETGIPIARIDIPANTVNITQAMIKDLRQMVDARTKTVVLPLQGVWPGTTGSNIDEYTDFVGGKTVWSPWPHDATFTTDCPDWATSVKVIYAWGQVQFIRGKTTGTNQEADGNVRVAIGNTATDPMRYMSRAGSPDYNRMSIVGADEIDLPKALRGTTITVEMQGKATANPDGSRAQTGGFQCDGGSSVYVELVFEEKPTYDVVDRTP